jgi:hypothetical protein
MMNQMLNISNPGKKIKNVIKDAIMRKQKEVKHIQNDLNILKQQNASGIYYTPINVNPESTIEYVAITIASFLMDILYGLKEGIKFVKQDVIKIQQKGGTNTDIKNGASELINQSDQLLNIIGGALENTKPVNSPTSSPSSSSLEEQAGTPSLSGVALDKAKDVGEALGKTGLKWSAEAMNNLIDYVMTATGEEAILDTPIDELSPELNRKVLILGDILKELAKNPATKEVIKETANVVADSADDFIDEMREPAIKIADHSIDLMKSVAEKFVSGATATTLSVVQSFLAEIPWIGGILDLFIAVGKGFNTLMGTYRIFVEKSSPVVLTGAETVSNTEKLAVKTAEKIKDVTQESVKGLETTIKDITSAVSTPTAPATAPATAPVTAPATAPATAPVTRQQQNGGSNKLNYAIIRGGKRLRKTMKKFHSTLPKLKYTDNKHRKTNKSKKKIRRRNKTKRR